MSLEDQYPELLTPQVVPQAKGKDIVSPPGFDAEVATNSSTGSKMAKYSKDKASSVDVEQLKTKKIWEIATGPAKSIPMNLIMSYMTGNSLQLIPIMMTVMLFINPLKAIFNDTNKIFKNLQTDKNGSIILQAKIVYILCQLGCMAIGIWKLNKMGLMPNSDADWLSFKSLPPINNKLVDLTSSLPFK